MGVSKESKEKVLELLVQGLTTEEISQKLNYSVGTVRKVFEEFREEKNVNTIKEICYLYLKELLIKEISDVLKCSQKFLKELNKIKKLVNSRNIATIQKADKSGKSTKKNKRKNKKS